MRTLRIALPLAAIGILSCWGNQPSAPPPPPPEPAPAPAPATPPGGIDPMRLAVFQPVPKEATSDTNPITDAKVDLGHHLFFATKLSSSGRMSCESCHELSKSGVDGLPLSKGLNGKPLMRNTPTVFNAALSSSCGWTGQADTLEHFLRAHLADPQILAATDAKVAHLPKGDAKLFAAAFPSDPKAQSLDNASLALGAYLRRLLTPSPWDKFLAGDQKALTDEQKKGFNMFADTGCMTCHAGVNVGGMLVQKLGLIAPWPPLKTGDQGRYDTTRNDDDKMMFRSAPLRNITKTAPYSVDGSVATLDEMVKLMAKHQLGKDLSDADTKSIVAFLTALEGTPPAELVANP